MKFFDFKLRKRNKELIGILFLLIISLIAILFFLFGIILSLVSLRNLILSRFNFSLVQILYLIIGVYIVYNSIKNCIKFYKNTINNPYKKLNDFYEKNKIEVILTAIISIILLFIYLNGLYLNYNFILKMALFFPIFVFQNLVFITKVFSKSTLKLLFLSSIFDLILPIVEVYYVYSIVKLISKLFKENKFSGN